MDKGEPKQGILFADRFLDNYAGSIISDPAVAIVELVANAWDAYATRVDIRWPKRTEDVAFSITDNGRGMSPDQFQKRWSTLDYHDPAMRWIVGGKASHGCAASPSQMGRFETRWLKAEKNLSALSDLSGRWIDCVHARRPPRGVVLDMDRA